MRCFSVTDVKMIGTSVNGAMRFFSASSKFLCVCVSFSTKSHLFITSTMPLWFREHNPKMLRSWESNPCEASAITMQTSEFSMERTARITE